MNAVLRDIIWKRNERVINVSRLIERRQTFYRFENAFQIAFRVRVIQISGSNVQFVVGPVFEKVLVIGHIGIDFIIQFAYHRRQIRPQTCRIREMIATYQWID